MELWIRSQNKDGLAKIHSINIEEKTSTKFSIVGNSEWILGIYETKERALKVLDEIQYHIKHQGESLVTSDNGIITGFKYYSNVYEMPEE